MDPSGTRPASRVLGLTGGIACGKSTVGDLLLELGAAECIDADAVVHELLSSSGDVTQRIRARFGADVILPGGAVNRPRLGRIVFADPVALHDLEAITHPAVRRTIRDRVLAPHDHPGTIVLDAVKLLQGDLVDLCEGVWVVCCSRDVQMNRLVSGRGMEVAAARDRLRAQPQFEHPKVLAEIQNDGSLADLRREVETAWRVWSQLPDSLPE